MAGKQTVDNRLTCLDLFAGAGGTSLGLEAAGFRTVGAVEFDKVAAETYRTNFAKNGPLIIDCLGPDRGDILTVDPDEIKRKLENADIRQLDLLVATPPCQGFSRIGRAKLDSLAAQAGAFIHDQRNQLYRQAVDMLKVLKPKAFLFENVSGILHLKGQNVAELVCQNIRDLGYEVRCALLNAAWYGVPQTRERVIIVGFRKDLEIVPEFPAIEHAVELWRGSLSMAPGQKEYWQEKDFFTDFASLRQVDQPKPAVSVRVAFADLPPFTKHLEAKSGGGKYKALRPLFSAEVPYRNVTNDYCHLMRTWEGMAQHEGPSDHFCRWTPRDFEIFRRMEPDDRYPAALKKAEAIWREACAEAESMGEPEPLKSQYVPPYPDTGFDEKWRKLVPDKPSWTVTAHLEKDTYSHIHFDSEQARMITLREAARIQSFPDGFVFKGNTGDAFRQIGNAVPPLLAKAVGKAIRAQLENAAALAVPNLDDAPVSEPIDPNVHGRYVGHWSKKYKGMVAGPAKAR